MTKISILIPTRGNSLELQSTILNCQAMATHPERLEFIIRADEDDWALPGIVKEKGVKVITGPRLGYSRIHDYYEECYQASTGHLLFAYNDDCRILTHGWDVLFETAMVSPLAEVASCDVSEGAGGYRWAFPMVRRSLCERIGRFCAGTETCDRIFDAYARSYNRGVHVPVNIIHKQAPFVPGSEREKFYNYAVSNWPEMLGKWETSAHEMNPHAGKSLEPQPRIHVIASFYNEELLVPFFLSHYSWADQIHALITPSPDRTVDILSAAPRVTESFYDSPRGMDDGLKIDKINEAIRALEKAKATDWIIVVDSDEFIWPEGRPNLPDPHDWLSSISPEVTVVEAAMFQVFRHKHEGDLDYTKEPIVIQRRHGSPDRNAPGCDGYIKPCIIRAGCGFQFEPGQHRLRPNPKIKMGDLRFDGSHWALADESLVMRRIRDRRDRLSETNRRVGWGTHVLTASEQGLLEACRNHENDPPVF